MKKIKLIASIGIFLLGTIALAAQEYEYQNPTGVELRYDKNGEVKSIIATGEADLLIGDSKDVRQATQKATLRAKANIAKFLNEEIKSKETLDEITDTALSTDAATLETQGTRDIMEKMTESLHNEANTILRGVVVLKTDSNPKEKYVTVTVGVKQDTINAAAKLNMQMKQSDKERLKNKIKEDKETERKVKKSALYDSF